MLCTGSNGSVTFYNVPPRDERNRPYILRAVGVSVDGVRSVVRRSVRPGELVLIIYLFN